MMFSMIKKYIKMIYVIMINKNGRFDETKGFSVFLNDIYCSLIYNFYN